MFVQNLLNDDKLNASNYTVDEYVDWKVLCCSDRGKEMEANLQYFFDTSVLQKHSAFRKVGQLAFNLKLLVMNWQKQNNSTKNELFYIIKIEEGLHVLHVGSKSVE
ncbi:hypothetical protein CEXT_207391 [Caerostris extrusa]|uniref:Uncharacterized protein n=1 Tax=Caerostris extrusa TaxID=172846 RepID=A0AAV4VQP2_CAEEX|nr:hypothetical protein CEXT_207391 [Caerostris extrusa]